jgi:hypothetical protein
LLLPLFLLLAGCTTKSYKASMAAGPARPADYPIPVYNEDETIPRPCKLIGQLSINATGLTVVGGSVEKEMKTVMHTAHEKGADVVQIVSVAKPDFNNPNYRLKASLLRYADDWETVAITEKDFLTYLQQHQPTLDAIEGIWFDGSAEQIGIMRDNSRPGREFVAFTLNSARPNWRRGYKKMDITRAKRPGAYNVTYYTDDFSAVETSLSLADKHAFNFIVRNDDVAYPVTFVKINLPAN